LRNLRELDTLAIFFYSSLKIMEAYAAGSPRRGRFAPDGLSRQQEGADMDVFPSGRKRLRLLHLFLPVCAILLCLPAQAAEQQNDPFGQLFGRQAFPAGTQDFPVHIRKHWLKVLQAEQKDPCLQRDASCLPQAEAPSWLYLVRKAPSMNETELLRTVNAFFNKFPSVPNLESYGAGDSWPTPRDFLNRRAGDGKAYALAKFFALRALGVPDDRLRIVLAHLPERKATHALLAVATAKGIFILDNAVRPTDLILPQSHFASRCLPLVMFNAAGRWTFRQDMELLRGK
jgi:predicted transglutaminase-like cysteine proteinase